jgi:transcriptional regulator with XRE-family HTH domain
MNRIDKRTLRIVGRNLRQARIKRTVSLDELSQGIAMSPVMIYRIETGQYNPWLYQLTAICAYLKQSPADMVRNI